MLKKYLTTTILLTLLVLSGCSQEKNYICKVTANPDVEKTLGLINFKIKENYLKGPEIYMGGNKVSHFEGTRSSNLLWKISYDDIVEGRTRGAYYNLNNLGVLLVHEFEVELGEYIYPSLFGTEYHCVESEPLF